jgi:Ca2+-transporting ATPase
LICLTIIFFYGFTRGDFVNGFLAGLSAAMSILPEEFAVVLTVFLALGAWRMSKSQVLTRRLNAIQSMGAATVLCTDKTGTLTLNKMTVQNITLLNGKEALIADHTDIDDEFHEVIEYAILASQKNPFDPMEKAILNAGHTHLENTNHLHNWELMKEYPLSRELLAVSNVWKNTNDNKLVIASKGAPEAIIDLCHLNKKQEKQILESVKKLSSKGLRVLGVARAELALNHNKELTSNQHDFKFSFIGLISFEDPVRKSVPASLQECYNAGLRVIMITGDYAGTAQHIAKEAGLANSVEVITGSELNKMSDGELREKIRTVNIFARVVPEQKLRIVKALKANGEVVIMTGDGVNDAPSLKAADIGIAMGSRGTEVARESAALVLLDDNFSSIEQAIRLGRRIYDNIKKAMSYIISIHIPIAGLALAPVLLNWPLIFFPAHIAFLELIIDPVCSVAFEAESEEKDIMKRKPRKKNEPLFDKKTMTRSVMQGVVVLIVTFFVYYFALNFGIHSSEQASVENARTLAFTTLVICNAFIILSLRSPTKTIIETLKQKNTSMWIVLSIAMALLAIIIYHPFFNLIFRFTPLHPTDLALCFAAGLLSVTFFEAVKMYNRFKSSGAKESTVINSSSQ